MPLPPDFAKNMFYNDLGEEQASHWTSLLKPQSVKYDVLISETV